MTEKLEDLSKQIRAIRGVEELHIHKWKNYYGCLWSCYCGDQRIFFPSIYPNGPQTPSEWDLQQGKIFAN